MHNFYFHFRTIIFLLLINTIIFALVALLAPSYWMENDDVAMAMIASGGFQGVPDCHLVFINALLGCVLAGLYSLTTAVEWYTIFQTMVHIFSASAIVWYIYRSEKHRWIKFVWLFFFYAFWVRSCISLQFTTTAGFSAVAGCLTLIIAVKKQHNKAKTAANALFCIGGGYLLASSLLRFSVTGLVVLLFTPYYLYQLKTSWKGYVPFAFIALILLGCKSMNAFFYHDAEWKYYTEYNWERGKLQDGIDAKITHSLPQGLSDDDYQLMSEFSGDKNIITLDILKSINQHNKTQVSKWEKLQRSIKGLIKRYPILLSILYALFATIIWLTPNKRKKIGLGIYAVALFVLLVGIGYNAVLKGRVFSCILLSEVMFAYILLPNMPLNKKIVPTMFCILLLIGNLTFAIIKKIYKNQDNPHVFETQMSLVHQIPDDGYLVSFCNHLKYEYIPPFHMKDYNIPAYHLGWCTNMPINNRAASFRDFTTPNCYIFIPKSELQDENSILNRVRRSILSNYGCQTNIETYAQKEDWMIIQLIPIENEVIEL